MKRYEYYLFDHSDEYKVGVVKRLGEITKSYNLNKGVVCRDYIPNECKLALHKSRGDLVTDIVDNIDDLVLISSAAKVIFLACGATDDQVEYLPFTLMDKKGNVASDQPYYIANCLRKIECVDFESIKQVAEAEDDKDDPELFFYDRVYFDDESRTSVRDLTYFCLKEDALPEDAVFFRIAESLEYMVIRSDLVEALQKAGMTGLCLKTMDKPI